MVNLPRTRDQHIAVFGESGSGKTVLVSSFYGPTQEGSTSSDLWDLVADDTGQGHSLLRNYLGMRDDATTPAQTKFRGTPYAFTLKLKAGDASEREDRPFDELRLVWHDYPGEWFEESPSSDEEAERRIDTFRSLLRSDVALLLVDGQKLLDYEGEEERYLRSLLANLRSGLLRLRSELLQGEERIVEFPRIWIVALSKADLLPSWDVYRFRDLIIAEATEPLADLRETLEGLVDTPEALAVGEDFLILSSAKFELASDRVQPVDIDVTQRVGIDLILPIASMLPLERRVQWSHRMEIPRRVVDTLADGAEAIAAALVGSRFVGKLLGRLPGRFGNIARDYGVPALTLAAELAGPRLQEMNAEARKKRDLLTATLTQFKIDLEAGIGDKVFIRSRR